MAVVVPAPKVPCTALRLCHAPPQALGTRAGDTLTIHGQTACILLEQPSAEKFHFNAASAALITLLSAVGAPVAAWALPVPVPSARTELCPPVPVLRPCRAVPSAGRHCSPVPSARTGLSPPVPSARTELFPPVPLSVHSCPLSRAACPRLSPGPDRAVPEQGKLSPPVPRSVPSRAAPAGGSGRWEMRQGRAGLCRGRRGLSPAGLRAHTTHRGQRLHRPGGTAGPPEEFGTAFLAAPHASAGEYQCLSPLVQQVNVTVFPLRW